MPANRLIRRLRIEELEPRIAPSAYNYWVTPSTTDGRFMALAGTGVDTIQRANQVEFGVPQGTASLNIGIFDGETGGMWDEGTQELLYTLYADPTGDGSSVGSAGAVIGSWLGSSMADNDWYNISAPTTGAAVGVDGNQYYCLDVRAANPDPTIFFISAYKLRTDATNFVMPQNFSFYVPMPSEAEARVLYPNWDQWDLTTTTYDGTWDFSFWVPSTAPSVTVWDADFDYGAHDLTANDTDDPNSPGIPSWAAGDPGVRAQGVAVGLNGATGNPQDDSEWEWYRRSPSVTYTLTDADANAYLNGNPSGNSEWEKFQVTSNGAQVDPNADYYVADALSAGMYTIHVDGLDVGNLVFWRIEYPPVTPNPKTYSVGDTVWWDDNHNGVQDGGEDGIAGIQVNLINGQETVIGTTTTNSSGWYNFTGLWPGTYTVEVDSGHFGTAGALTGYATSTGNELTRQVVDADVMTYDFGYYGATIGDYVWHDQYHSLSHAVDGLQDGDEAGIAGVVVQLYSSSGSLLGSTTTDASGLYHFTRLRAGDYTVKVADSNFTTGGAMQTLYTTDGQVREQWYASQQNIGTNDAIDSDGHETTHNVSVTLAAGENDDTIDFGFFKSQIDLVKTGPTSVVYGPVVALSPGDGETYTSPIGHNYTVEDPTSNPFYGIKFTEQGSGVKNGAYDTFTFTVSTAAWQYYDASHPLTVYAKAGTTYRQTTLAPIEGSSATSGSFTFTLLDVNVTGDTTDLTIKVKNSYTKSLSSVEFSLPPTEVISYHFWIWNSGDVVLHGGAHIYDAMLNPSGDHEIWSDVFWPGEIFEFDKVYRPTCTGEIVNVAYALGHPEHPGRNGAYEESGTTDDYYIADVHDKSSWTVQVLAEGSQSMAMGAGEESASLTEVSGAPAETSDIIVLTDLAQSEGATTTEADSPAPAPTEAPADETLTVPADDATLAILSGPITVSQDLDSSTAPSDAEVAAELLAAYPELWSTDTLGAGTASAEESETVSAPQTSEDYVVSEIQVVAPDAGATGDPSSDFTQAADPWFLTSSSADYEAPIRLDSTDIA